MLTEISCSPDTVTFGAVSLMITTITLLAVKEFDEGITILLACGVILSSITTLVCVVLQCLGTSESKMIDRELKAATKNTRRLQSEPEAIGSDQRVW